MYKVKVLKINEDKVTNCVEHVVTSENDLIKSLKEFSSEFNPESLRNGYYFEVLLSEVNKNEVDLLWVQRLY